MQIPSILFHVTSQTRAEAILKTPTVGELYFADAPMWGYTKRPCAEDGAEPACIVLDLTLADLDCLPFEIEFFNVYHREWVAMNIPSEFLKLGE